MQGGENRRRSARGSGRRQRPSLAGLGVVGGGTPAGTPGRNAPTLVEPAVKAIRCRDQRAGGGRPAPHGGADRGRLRPRRTRAHRGAAVCTARRVAQIRRPRSKAGGAGRQICRDVALIDAGAGQLKQLEAAAAGGRQALQRRRHQTLRGADKIRRKTQQGRQCRTRALKLERAKFTTQVESDAGSPGPQGFDRVEFWVQTNPGTKPGR